MSEKTCRNCGVRTFPQTAPQDEKDRLRALGYKRQCGRGVCVNCYERYRKAGRIEELSFVSGTSNVKGCVRCGIKHSRTEDLCQDCIVVARDLDELERWSA